MPAKIKKGDKREAYKNIIVARPKNFTFGNDMKPKGSLNLKRFVKFPCQMRIQKHRKILLKRLAVPPAVHQFSLCADKLLAHKILNFLKKYKPESPEKKAERLKQAAANKAQEKAKPVDEESKRIDIVRGIDAVVSAIEKKEAKLVVIAHDVFPIETIVFLPALCKKMNVPYAVVKSQSRLGDLTFSKRNTCVCLTKVRKDDREEFNQLLESVKGAFNERFYEASKKWGGKELSAKTQQTLKKYHKSE